MRGFCVFYLVYYAASIIMTIRGNKDVGLIKPVCKREKRNIVRFYFYSINLISRGGVGQEERFLSYFYTLFADVACMVDCKSRCPPFTQTPLCADRFYAPVRYLLVSKSRH